VRFASSLTRRSVASERRMLKGAAFAMVEFYHGNYDVITVTYTSGPMTPPYDGVVDPQETKESRAAAIRLPQPWRCEQADAASACSRNLELQRPPRWPRTRRPPRGTSAVHESVAGLIYCSAKVD
jgi:hypothetical protein